MEIGTSNSQNYYVEEKVFGYQENKFGGPIFLE